MIYNILKYIYDGLLKIERAILIVTSLLVVFIISCVVFMRYVLQIDLFAYDELVMIVAFWMYFIGAAYGSYEDSQIKADIIQVALVDTRPKLAAYINLFARSLELFLAANIAYWSWSLVYWQFKFMGHTMGWGIPILVPQSAIFLGFALMTLYAAVHAVKAWQRISRKEYPISDAEECTEWTS
ncbi:TRAP transporter small permease [Halodesulfovibrio sp. MK-HDV]|uniref:TRAP transporter small permease n=1 Tax=Halodesulfovibrio sp. MK-HDV TaxID=2599925 RepID=UPI00136FD2A0|nr:TRAP transporter small permease [Halodesulfovibrio sp. MK-HDV]KAF1077857.1 hypothetical protein MKHDV_00317 [Halodesulfovibrio sp. MK-HDV]